MSPLLANMSGLTPIAWSVSPQLQVLFLLSAATLEQAFLLDRPSHSTGTTFPLELPSLLTGTSFPLELEPFSSLLELEPHWKYTNVVCRFLPYNSTPG